jgi:deoxyadenosine/deoxycytidine kinase
MYLFTIEGCIGSGKSTFIDILKREFKHFNGIPIVYIPEPVEEWESIVSVDNQNMIQLFYADQTKYAFSFQMMAYISRLSYLKKAMRDYPNCILISERSLLADYNVFAKMLYSNGSISQENYQIYKKWFDEFLKDIPITGYIYMKTETDVCFERCNKRARKGESITLDYLEQCNELHENWLDTDSNVLTLTTNSVEDVETVIDYISESIPVDDKYSRLICIFGLAFLATCNIAKIIWIFYR